MGQMEFYKLDVRPVAHHHLFPSMVIFPHSQTSFHGILETKDTTCMMVTRL